MEYVVIFLAGGLAAASGLAIWYFEIVRQTRKARRMADEATDRLKGEASRLSQQISEQDRRRLQLDEAIAAFQARKVQYDDLVRENSGLKQDLFNISVQWKKAERDQAAITARQDQIVQQMDQMATRYLNPESVIIKG